MPGALTNGSLLSGRYRLGERIATGGMGQVWRATDQLLGRPVAVKLLSARHAADEQFRTRFQAEARYAASLSHPGIARVYDYGESRPAPGAVGRPEPGVPYLVMELVEGEPLSAAIASRGRMTAAATLDIVAQAARALAAAHAAGIVHRDIKPGNLLLTPEHQVKITDFGIARAAVAARLTQTGMVVGTAQYVSPEQASARPVTAAADIYSLGVVAYECLAGRPPFSGQTPIALAAAHVNSQPPPLPADVPAAVAALVRQMLAKDPADRPASANVVAARASALHTQIEPQPGGGSAWLAGAAGSASPAAWFSEASPTSPAVSQGGTTPWRTLPSGPVPGSRVPGGRVPGGTIPGGAGPGTGAGGGPRARPRRRVAGMLAAAALVLAAVVGAVIALVTGRPAAAPAHRPGSATSHPVAPHTRRGHSPPRHSDQGNVVPDFSPAPASPSQPASAPVTPSSPASPPATAPSSPSASPTGSPSPSPPSTPPSTPPSSPTPTPTQTTNSAQTPLAGSQPAGAATQDG